MNTISFDRCVEECTTEIIENKLFEKANGGKPNEAGNTSEVNFAPASNQETDSGNESGEIKPKKKPYRIDAKTLLLTVNPIQIPHFNDIVKYLKGKNPNYMIATWHKGGCKHEHIHIYVQYTEKKTLSANKLFNCHMKKTTKSAQYSRAYCLCVESSGKHKKKGIYAELIFEEGIMNLNGGFYNMKAEDCAAMSIDEMKQLGPRELLIAAKVKNIVAEMNEDVQYYDEMRNMKKSFLEGLPERSCTYITGPSRSGKTLTAKMMALSTHEPEDTACITFDENGFAHAKGNKTDAKAIVFEEFRDDSMTLKKTLEVTDNYVTSINCKGSHINCCADEIYMASVIPLSDLYKNAVTKYDNKSQLFNRIAHYYYMDEDHIIWEVKRENYDCFKYLDLPHEYIESLCDRIGTVQEWFIKQKLNM